MLRFIDDRDFLMAHVDRLTDRVEIAITSLAGKFKLSQNRRDADTHGVMAGLDRSALAHDPEVADAMRAHAPHRPTAAPPQ